MSFTRNGCSTLYVGNLSDSIPEHLLVTVFTQFGPIKAIRVIKKDEGSVYAFVEFFSNSVAAAALNGTHGRMLVDRKLIVNWANRWIKTEFENHHEVYVGNLSVDVNECDLKNVFSPFGYISKCTVTRSKDNLITRGYVVFVNQSDALKAISTMNGKTMKGKTIQVRYSKNNSLLPAPAAALQDGRAVDNSYHSDQLIIRTVFCGGVFEGLTPALVEKVFSPFGTIVVTPQVFTTRGYAFIEFSTRDEAKAAIEAINNTVINGYVVNCSWATKQKCLNSTDDMSRKFATGTDTLNNENQVYGNNWYPYGPMLVQYWPGLRSYGQLSPTTWNQFGYYQYEMGNAIERHLTAPHQKRDL